MRVVLQRVTHASVTVKKQSFGAIDAGLLVFLGIHPDDEQEDIEWLVNKLVNLRIFEDEEGKMNRSVSDIKGDILVVSQFTLYGNSKKGHRPSFNRSAPPDVAIPLYDKFLEHLRANFEGEVPSGEFGAEMKVSLLNDGPVTLIIDSHQRNF